MIQYLIAGLVGGAVALAKKPKKMERGGRLDEEDIKDRLYDMGVDYEDLMENAGMDLDAIQDQYLGYVFDPITATWGRGYAQGGVNDGSDEILFVKEDDESMELYIFKNANGNYTWRILYDGEIQEEGSEPTKSEATSACIEALGYYRVRYAQGGRLRNIDGGRIIMQQARSFNTYAEPVSKEVEQSAKDFVYRLDALFETLSLPHIKHYGWNGSSFEAVGSYDIFIEKGDDYNPETRYILDRDYHDAIEKALKFMCDLTGAKLEEYDREAPNVTGSVATIDIDAMVEAQEQERAKLRKRFGFE